MDDNLILLFTIIKNSWLDIFDYSLYIILAYNFTLEVPNCMHLFLHTNSFIYNDRILSKYILLSFILLIKTNQQIIIMDKNKIYFIIIHID